MNKQYSVQLPKIAHRTALGKKEEVVMYIRYSITTMYWRIRNFQ